MLKSLHIENIAVIESTDIELLNRFNTLTGETGAGKSIVIDAINAVLGERTSKELIRSGCDKAEVIAIFEALSEHSIKMLSEYGFAPDENGQLLIRRVLSLSGNGSIKINGKPATATLLRTIGKTLVNIHGQHDNQALLDKDTHYIYIDRLAENSVLLTKYYEEFKNLNSIRKELDAIENDEDEKIRLSSLLKHQITELSEADIKIGELHNLREQLHIAENYKKIFTSLNEAQFLISGNTDSDGAASLLKNANIIISSLSGNDFSSISEKLSEISALLENISFDIRKYTDNTDFSQLDSEKIRQRLDQLHKLMLKYGDSEEKMLAFLDNAQRKLENINLSDKYADDLAKKMDESTERLVALGDKITEKRAVAAAKFSKDVTQILRYLDMPDVDFYVDIKKGKYTKTGCDLIEFLIRTNAGEDIKPLCKIASGGELSRVMLAIKSVLAGDDDVDTLIFDEIDTGISGKAAGKVGVQLKNVSQTRQVICVTHLAQIAAFADNHLLIKKYSEQGRTFTTVSSLSYEERISEIARIMSGTEITENLYNSAKELLDRSKAYENL